MLKLLLKIVLVLVVLVVAVAVAALLFLWFYPGVGKTPDKAAQAAYAEKMRVFYDGEFHNTDKNYTLMAGGSEPRSGEVRPADPSDIPVVDQGTPERGEPGQMTVSWLGHSSALVQMGAKNILIDPVLTDYSSPVGFVGVKRFSAPGLTPQEVPEIDVLFISHDHYDHLDYQTIRQIDDRVACYVVPLGVDAILKGWGIESGRIRALTWWETTEIDGIRYSLTESQHFSGRNPLKSSLTLWGGLRIDDGIHSLYYTGDGGYCDAFRKEYQKYGEVDLILAENGQYSKGWPMVHMTPEESVQAAKDAHAQWYIPVHWGAFVLSTHAWYDPALRAVKAGEAQEVEIATPRIGELVPYDDIDRYDSHWWEEAQ